MVKKLGKLKVLVVEDSKVAIKAISSYLQEMGVHLMVAENGKDAIELYRNERPDIILLDIILPDIDGYEVAREVRRLQSKDDWTAIIFLSVMSRDEDLVRGLDVGGDDYLMKPVGRVVLQAKVNAMYRLVRMQRALVKLTEQLNAANSELQRLSMTDGLTGIANRRLFDESLVREWRRCGRIKKPLSVVLLDVDYFKKYNDEYGHQEGDDCLKLVAKEMARATPRPGDLVARYGGEEFALILAETDRDGARWVAERIRQQIGALNIPHSESSYQQVTISCGVASVIPSDELSAEQLLKSADVALYIAKEHGRNRVECLEYGEGD
ncbi:MAG TPA: diguanylate cyclase [Gallionella sp.]|nr:diguanylate cyclase [Gallionella sp.]